MSEKYTDLVAKYHNKGRQFGQYLIFIESDGISEKLHGYRITSFVGYDPKDVEYVKTIATTGIASWNSAYDRLFGHPSGFPDFTKAINL